MQGVVIPANVTSCSREKDALSYKIDLRVGRGGEREKEREREETQVKEKKDIRTGRKPVNVN